MFFALFAFVVVVVVLLIVNDRTFNTSRTMPMSANRTFNTSLTMSANRTFNTSRMSTHVCKSDIQHKSDDAHVCTNPERPLPPLPDWSSGMATTTGTADMGLESSTMSSPNSELKVGTPLVTLPGAWRYWLSIGTGWTGDSIL